MNFKDYVILLFVAILLIVAVAALFFIFVPEGDSERYSEFWLLGSNHLAEEYPFNVYVGEEYSVFVGVGNHMGSSEDYIVRSKFGNSIHNLPDVEGSVASSLPPLIEYDFSLDADQIWESHVEFSFENVVTAGDAVIVGDLIVDGVSFPVNISTSWDFDREGYFFQLFFELWRYDGKSDSFKFEGRSVELWLNLIVTAS